jgi:hypothetical protein
MAKVNLAFLIRNSARDDYFGAMPKFEFCIPTPGKAVPSHTKGDRSQGNQEKK